MDKSKQQLETTTYHKLCKGHACIVNSKYIKHQFQSNITGATRILSGEIICVAPGTRNVLMKLIFDISKILSYFTAGFTLIHKTYNRFFPHQETKF